MEMKISSLTATAMGVKKTQFIEKKSRRQTLLIF
jgi:hypothetical protein